VLGGVGGVGNRANEALDLAVLDNATPTPAVATCAFILALGAGAKY